VTTGGGTLGVIAGGGELPIAIAEAASAAGRDVFVVALDGSADGDVSQFRHGFAGLGELGKVVKLLKAAQVSEITFAGRVARPNLSSLKLDSRAALALPKLLAAARKGDDAVLRAILALMEREGFRVIGTAEAAPMLLAPRGNLGTCAPSEVDRADLTRAYAIVKALGEHDIGQAAAVCEGLALAVEAAEGTDEMIRRIGSLPGAVRGTPERRRGVLVKAPKPRQERRVDLPVIGARTVELAASVGLAGIAVEAGAAIVMNRPQVVAAADKAGLFVFGFTAQDLAA
jgi:DUF1009 family protein